MTSSEVLELKNGGNPAIIPEFAKSVVSIITLGVISVLVQVVLVKKKQIEKNKQ